MDRVDIDRFERVRRLGAVPYADRNEQWGREFEDAFWAAPLCAFEPKELNADDGRSYFRVSTRAWQDGFEFVRPAGWVDRTIEEGKGLCVSDENDRTILLISLGQVLSYRLYGRAFSRQIKPAVPRVKIEAGETLRIGEATEAIFPFWARRNARLHLQTSLGIETPRACYVGLPDGRDAIVFDLEPKRINDEQRLYEAFAGLRWLMPDRLVYLRLDEVNDVEQMRPF